MTAAGRAGRSPLRTLPLHVICVVVGSVIVVPVAFGVLGGFKDNGQLSTSPFGLLDMVGNAYELTVSEEGAYTLRGGSFAHDRRTAHLTNRGRAPDTMRDAVIGFRLCATPQPRR